MTIWETGFTSKYVKETSIEGDAVHMLYLHPKDPSSVEYHTIVLYISKEKNELKKVTVKTKDGTSMIYMLKKYTANPEIDDTKFVYDANKYPGYTLIKD